MGVGSSAGGLESLEQLFRSAPTDGGIAWVLVPHLDPNHASLLAEILQRATAMPVSQAIDGQALEPNTVVVVPPNRELTLGGGRIRVSLSALPRGQRMPIDRFFRSLAEECGERAIGVVLSGSGTDGSLGVRAIHGAGGVSFVQEPATATFDGMPLSAAAGGMATFLLPPAAIAPRVVEYVRSRFGAAQEDGRDAAPTTKGIEQLLALLRMSTGHDFSLYKRSTITRRIERRMAVLGASTVEEYSALATERADELQVLFQELLINVTSFFRDPAAFAALERELPQLFAECTPTRPFRAWVPACATGEEAYSIAILLREQLNAALGQTTVKLYATDIDEPAIAAARSGFYPPNIVSDISPERLTRFFDKEDAGYRIRKAVREMMVFARQDLVHDPPFTRLDLISCRNVLIYLEPELQNRLLATFHFALRPGGLLLLSPSESIGAAVDLFRTVDRRHKLFAAKPTGSSTRLRASSLAGTQSPWRPAETLPQAAREPRVSEVSRRALLDAFAPPAVLIDERGAILFVHGDTGPYLRPAPGQPTLDLPAMTRDELQVAVRSAIADAVAGRHEAVATGTVTSPGREAKTVTVTVRPIAAPGAEPLRLLVTFEPRVGVRVPPGKIPVASRKTGRLRDLEREVLATREGLQASLEALQLTNEELRAANEELQSANEELQSTNEELQSTNEELETSREELQSVNEELVTLNAELQAKIEQLAVMQNDMKNLLDSTQIGMMFLDLDLAIRRFTRETTAVFRLAPSDVGRPLADIRSNLVDDSDLVEQARTVLSSLTACDRQVTTRLGVCYLTRLMPYRTVDNVVEGVVMTFTDISAIKAIEAKLRATQGTTEAAAT